MITPFDITSHFHWGNFDALTCNLKASPWILKATIWAPLSKEGRQDQAKPAIEQLLTTIGSLKTKKGSIFIEGVEFPRSKAGKANLSTSAGVYVMRASLLSLLVWMNGTEKERIFSACANVMLSGINDYFSWVYAGVGMRWSSRSVEYLSLGRPVIHDDLITTESWMREYRTQLYNYAIDPSKKPAPWNVLDREESGQKQLLFY